MKNKVSLIIGYFFALLFAYAAFGKFADFENFQLQLAQSPLLNAYAVFMSYAVLLIELVVALFLCIRRTRLLGLYLSLWLMVAFSVYIYMLLNYTSVSTCSCSGIFEKMSFETHLWFNIACIGLAVLGVLLHSKPQKHTKLSIALSIFLGIALVLILYFTSQHTGIRKQDFTRTFLALPLPIDKQLDLQANSYYIAGHHNNTIYLGNYTAVFSIAEVDSTLENFNRHIIDIDNKEQAFYSVKTKVLYPYFFTADGISAVIFRGQLGEWKAKTISHQQTYFTDFVPLDSIHLVLRGQSGKTKQSVLGLLDVSKDSAFLKTNFNLLEKQVDGVFDSDGMLRYSPENQKILYTYFYRNQYLVADKNLELLHRGTTIDTTTVAKIQTQQLKTGAHKMRAPDVSVNSRGVVHHNLLFNISNIMGQGESHKQWKQAVVVDVYDYELNQYIGSFYIEDVGAQKLSDMVVTNKFLYGLFGNELVRFALPKPITQMLTVNP